MTKCKDILTESILELFDKVTSYLSHLQRDNGNRVTLFRQVRGKDLQERKPLLVKSD